MRPLEGEYDVIVVGGGPAGLTAGIYLALYGLKAAIITKEVGGTLNRAGWIENYPGIPKILGPELARRFENHVRKFGIPIIIDTVVDIVKDGEGFRVRTERGFEYKCKAVILAVGVEKRSRLGVPGEERFIGRGISYCAICDALLYRGKTVAVIGCGDAALSSALLLAEHASKVYLICKGAEPKARKYLIERAFSNPKIECLLRHVVREFKGDEALREVVVQRVDTGETFTLNVDGVFLEIGVEPPRGLFEKIGVETTDDGYVKINERFETNVPGIFAAGDCTSLSRELKQIVVAAGQGALAAYYAYRYIIEKVK